MDFGWLKKIFKKKEYITNTSDISIIDTSFIRVPKLSELKDEERLLVEKYLQELKYDDYESVLKYSDELLNKSNSEIEFFMVSLDEILKDISSVINEVSKGNYFKLLISKEEIKQSIDEFYKIIDEAKLRLVALDAHIKKEELRKYDFLGVFGKAERLKYLNDKSKLLNERDRLKTTIKISSQHLLATFKALEEEKILLNNMESYISGSKLFDTNYCDDRVCVYYVRDLLDKKKLCDSENCDELKKLCDYIYSFDCDICIFNVSGEYYNESISNLKMTKLIPFLVKEAREIKKYAYNHRNDYKKIIIEIGELVQKYQTTSSGKWDINELEMTIRKYVSIATNYVIICNKYLNDDVLKQLRERLFELNYFFNISVVRREHKSGNMSPLGKSLILGEYTRPIINSGSSKDFYILLRSIRGWNWEYEEERKYYDKLSCEMLKTVGILNLPINNYKSLEKQIERIVKELKDKEELHYLFDIYNNDYNSFDLRFNTRSLSKYLYVDKSNDETSFYTKTGLELYFDRIKKKYFKGNTIYNIRIKQDENVLLDDVFYLDKLLKTNGLILDEIFNCFHCLEQEMNYDLLKILVYSYFKYLDLNCDKRIFIIPPQVKFNQVLEFKPLLKSLNDLNINDNHIAIYLTNWGQVNAVHRVLKEKESHIKYLIMSKKLYLSYKDVYRKDLKQKAIVVPDNTEYSKLSCYLDKQLEKEKGQQKIKSKII